MSRIVIVDDHPMIRHGLAVRIEQEPGLEICGEAADVDDGLRVIAKVAPDLAIIDISLKTGSGLSLVERLNDRPEPPRMLVWSIYEDSVYADRALRAGAMGYVNKQASPDEIVRAIRRVLDGKVYVSPEMSDILLSRMVRGREGVQATPSEELSNRELETLQHVGHGLTTRQIAERMNLSPKTIETYRTRVKGKLGIESMAELTRYATQWVLENG